MNLWIHINYYLTSVITNTISYVNTHFLCKFISYVMTDK